MNKLIIIVAVAIAAVLCFTVASVFACTGFGCGAPIRMPSYSYPSLRYNINWKPSCSQYTIRIPKFTVSPGAIRPCAICQRIGISFV